MAVVPVAVSAVAVRPLDAITAVLVVALGVAPVVAVHDRGRAVAVAVVHGRAWPSCVWPWCRVRLCVVVMSWRPGCVCGVSCLWWCRGRDVALRMV